MLKFRKILSLGIFVLLLFSTSLAAAAALPDVTEHWAEEEIRQLVDMGAITGYPDGTYRPENTISRAELSSVLRGALGLEETATSTFPDKAGHWGQGRIGALIQAGVIDTDLYGEAYGPDEPITREEIAMMTVRMLGDAAATEAPFTDAGQIGEGFRQYVAEAYSKGIITGYPDNTFRPAGTATRAEAAVMVIRALSHIDDEDDPMPGQVSDEPYVFRRAEYFEVGENAAEFEDIEIVWDDKVRFISDELADKILQAEKETGDKEFLIKLTKSEAVYEPEEYLVHVEKHVAYMVRKIIGDDDEDDDPQHVTYLLGRAGLEEIFEDFYIPEQSIKLNLDNLVYVAEGIEVEASGNPSHTFRFTNQQYFGGAITVNGEIRLFSPSIDAHYKLGTRGDRSSFHLELHAGEEIDIDITGQLAYARSREFFLAGYAVPGGNICQAWLGLFLVIDVDGNISFEYRIEQGYHLRLGVRGDKGRIFPEIDTVRFYYEPESWLDVDGNISGELQLMAGVKAGFNLNIFSYDIFYLAAECGVAARAEFEVQLTAPYQSCFSMELYAYLDASGKVMYIVPKLDWPPWESRVREFSIYYNTWLIYQYLSCDEEMDGAFGTGEQALVQGANTLSVRSAGASRVPVSSTTGHGGTTNYLLTGITSGTRVNLEAPEYVGEGAERKRFVRWDGIRSSTNRTISFTINDREANLDITAHYVDAAEIYTLQVRAPEGVEISSTTGHGGHGSYELSEIAPGTTVTLEAPGLVGSAQLTGLWKTFEGWSGAVDSTDQSITFAVNEDMTVTANYSDPHSLVEPPPGYEPRDVQLFYSLEVNSFSIMILMPSVDISSNTGHGGSTSYTLPLIRTRTEVHLEAPEYIDDGAYRYYFSHWSGALESSNQSIVFTMDADKNVTAHYEFGRKPVPGAFDLTVSSSEDDPKMKVGVDIISKTGHGGRTQYTLTDITAGTEIILEAPLYLGSGDERKRFEHWSGALKSKEPGISITLNNDTSLTANYVNDPESIFTRDYKY